MVERARQYVAQIGNPCAFAVDGIAVNLVFSSDGKTLDEALFSYLLSIKKKG